MVDNGPAQASRATAPGSAVSFPYDRMTVEQFRQDFPRARWDDQRKAWFVPGKTARQRFERWIERQHANESAYADARGKDAYAFEPIHSPYLHVHADRLEVETPYSPTIVELLRQIPFAAWDGTRKLWTVPFRSFEDLQRRWPDIEAAAQRNEPALKKARQAAKRGSDEEKAARLRSAERRRRRYPLDPNDLPPLDRPVMTRVYGIVVFMAVDGELVPPEAQEVYYGHLPTGRDYVWGSWRTATLGELIRTWPSKAKNPTDPQAIWWQPTIEELRLARKVAQRRGPKHTET